MPITTPIQPPISPRNVISQLGDDNITGNNLYRTWEFCDNGIPTNLPRIDLLSNTVPLDLSDAAWEFDLRNGAASMARRGFYSIEEVPYQLDVINIPVWHARVVYYPAIGANKLYTFRARIGPLVNQHAIRFHMSRTNPKILSGVPEVFKERYLGGMVNKLFYVSQQASLGINNNHIPYMKQTTWFRFDWNRMEDH